MLQLMTTVVQIFCRTSKCMMALRPSELVPPFLAEAPAIAIIILGEKDTGSESHHAFVDLLSTLYRPQLDCV